jgi:hypothetical protein
MSRIGLQHIYIRPRKDYNYLLMSRVGLHTAYQQRSRIRLTYLIIRRSKTGLQLSKYVQDTKNTYSNYMRLRYVYTSQQLYQPVCHHVTASELIFQRKVKLRIDPNRGGWPASTCLPVAEKVNFDQSLAPWWADWSAVLTAPERCCRNCRPW